MNFQWLDNFEDRASRLTQIEREDSRDRGRSTGNRGYSSSGGGGGGLGAPGPGNPNNRPKTYRGLPVTNPQTGYTTSYTETPYGAPVHYDYKNPLPDGRPTMFAQSPTKWSDTQQAVKSYNERVEDERNRHLGPLDQLGNLLGGMGGLYETADPYNPENKKTKANWKLDPFQAALTALGIATGLPAGTVYGAATGLAGHPKFGQINLGTDVFGPGQTTQANPAHDQQYSSSSINDIMDRLGLGGGGTGSSNGPGSNTGGGGTFSNAPVSPLQHILTSGIPFSPQQPSPSTTPRDSGTGAGTPAPWQTYNPYARDYLTYGERPEHDFFAPARMAEGGAVQAAGIGGDTATAHVTPGEIMIPPELYQSSPGLLQAIMQAMHETGMDPEQYIVGGGAEDEYNDTTGMPQYGFWKTIKKILKHAAPVAIGAGTSALTGSDILGGLAAGTTSKLFGNSWLEAGLTGLGTGVASNLTGISGGDAAAGASSMPSALNSIGDFVKDNPMQSAGAALAVAAALGAGKGGGQTSGYEDAVNPGANDPTYAAQIRNGGQKWGRTANAPDDKVNWYQYGEFPEWDYFSNENAFTPAQPHLKRGGDVPGETHGALSTMGGQAQGPGGGQDDKIPVYLSAKEYVVPADVVADLGDGNADEGAKKLDGMRDKVRKHKGRKGFPPKAKAKVEAYI